MSIVLSLEEEDVSVDSNRKKRASAWFYQTLYRDEAIQPHPLTQTEAVPKEIRAMRALESGVESWRLSREAIFVRQAHQMADYEDDYDFNRDLVRYFPTYQSLTDRELRGYFTWRSKWRRGERIRTSLSFAFLYIYELLNQIGVKDPVDGFEKLKCFEREYALLDDAICSYLKSWLWDYVVYYRLDPVLLADRPELAFDRDLAVLREIGEHSDVELFQAILSLSAYRLDRSKLYSLQPELVEKVVPRVLRKMDAHYTAHRKQRLTEDYFGPQIYSPATMFQGAVFYECGRRGDFEYTIDALRSYRYRDGRWTVYQPDASPTRSKKLGDLVRTVDSKLREMTGAGNPIQPGLSVKWILKLIDEEIRACLLEREKEAASHISIDFTKLSGIRHDASLTQEKLIVDEEREQLEEPGTELKTEEENTRARVLDECPLDEKELRLLCSLLYGGGLDWVREEGFLLSLLVDGINEKLFDRFGDTVLLYDTEPELIDDYTKELKEMVKP